MAKIFLCIAGIVPVVDIYCWSGSGALPTSSRRHRWLAPCSSCPRYSPKFGLSLVVWTPIAFDIHYHLGVDGISMPLILLTTVMTVLVVLAGWESVQYRPAQYLAAFLIQEGLMVGAFSALGLLLVLFGVWPAPLLEVVGPSVEHLVEHLSRSKL